MADRKPWEDYAPAKPQAAPWEEYAAPAPARAPVAAPVLLGAPTGRVADGDTFALSSGPNARLLGVDAFELRQTGRRRSGETVPLGRQARDALIPFARPDAAVTPTGDATYGRPVVTLDRGGDAGAALLDSGMAVAQPRYLSSVPVKLQQYMEAERLARLNQRGAWAGSFEQPATFRDGRPDPWAKPVPGKEGESTAVFWDEPMPFQGLRPEIADGYLGLAKDMSSTPDEMLAYARDKGFQVNEKEVRSFYAHRARDGVVKADAVEYQAMPRVLTDRGDGAFGAGLRGFVDPINMLDEVASVGDALIPGTGRENVWSSDRRFGDILANNLDQNRSILAFDDAKHPYARFAGQLVGGVALPGASVEGVGLAAARTALRGGASRYAAEQAARSAVVRRLGVAGAVEGGLAGAGQGEDLRERAFGAAIGAPVGFGLGAGTGLIAPKIAAAVGRRFGKAARAEGRRTAQDLAAGAVVSKPDGGPVANVAAMKAYLDLGSTARRIANDAGPVRATARADATDEAMLSPVFVAPKGKPGFSIEDTHGDGHVLYSVFRDENGDAKGVVSYPATPEGRQPVPDYSVGMASYVDPAFRRQGIASKLYDQLRDAGHDVDGLSGTADLTPNGAAFVNARRAAAMDREGVEALQGPWDDYAPPVARTVDRIDVNAGPRPLLRDTTDYERFQAAERIAPGDVLPIPSNTVASMAEAEGIAAGRFAPVRAPDERATLSRDTVPNATTGAPIQRRGPADLVTWLRSQGGVRPQGGELAHYGIDNAPRKGMDFTGREQQLGRLVDPDNGMNYDDAALRAWEAGYFPDHVDRPSVDEFLDALNATHTGNNRAFRSDDLSEVDAFEQARRQRWDVEGARERGAPMVEDWGRPVGLDDLEANAPPVSAYEEWGENAPDLAGNIRLDKLDSPQAIKRALVQVDRVSGGFDAARRGRITQAETERLASEMNLTPADLLNRPKGQALNAEQALAARQILAKSGNELVNMAKRLAARAGDASDEEQVAFRAAIVRHAAIQEQVAGATAEAGRALSQFRMEASSRAVRGEVLKGLLAQAGGPDGIKRAADMIVDAADDPKRLNAVVEAATSPKLKDKLIELWYNWLLSGPRTHAVNITSNLLTSLAQIPEHVAAAGVGAVRKALPGQAETDRVLFSEAGARTVGLLQGAREGFGEFARTLRTGTTRDFVTKVEAAEQNAIGGKLGTVLRTPTRLLSAEDELFKAMARRMELSGLAVRMTAKEGLKGQAARDRVAELAANPTPEMLERAFDYGRYVTFQRPLGPIGNLGTNLLSKAWPLKLFIPFLRTPANLLKFAAERSPVAPLMREVRTEFAAGGARRDLAVARMMVGTGAMMLSLEAAREGKFTGGGPADKSAKRLLEADGWQPYSVRVGDRYYSYQRFDPFSTTIGLAADYVDLQEYMTDEERDEVAGVLLAATVKNLSNKTWLSGMSSLTKAVDEPDRYGGNALARLAGSIAVPALVAQSAQAVDPVQREARGMLDRIRSRVPYASRALPPRRDVLGRPLRSGSEGGIGAFSPLFTSTRRNDVVANALLKAGVSINKPGRKVGDPDRPGKKIELNPGQYDRYQVLAAQFSRPELETLVDDPGWSTMQPEDQQAAAGTVLKDARKQARDMLFAAGGIAAVTGGRPVPMLPKAPAAPENAPWLAY